MTVELAIIGAGPAGMAAAVLAAEFGVETALIDEQASPGGQIYRGIERSRPNSPLGPDDLAGRDLVAALRANRVEYRPSTTLWHIDPDGALYLETNGRSEVLTAYRILLAIGAFERPVPIPGWTLPGVMAAGAAQILLKSADLVPEGRAVLGGQGPLLYLVAAQLARAGAPPIALLETTPWENHLAAARQLDKVWAGRRILAKGLGLIFAVRRAGVPVRGGVRGLRAIGQRSLERVAWDGGELAADHLFLHEGVIPNVQVSLALQLRHEWDESQLCWRPALDPWGQTSLPNIVIAGDGGGIAGAEAAALSGRLAALDAAAWLGHIGEPERDRRAAPGGARSPASVAAVSRSPLSPGGFGPRPGRGRNHRVPLRGGVGRPDPRRRAARRARSKPAQGVHPLRHGTLPRPDLRPDRLGRHRRRARQTHSGNRHLPPARPVQADHRRRPRRSRHGRERPRRLADRLGHWPPCG